MGEKSSKLEADRKLLIEAQKEGGLATCLAYARLSGPGWLQSALTLGGGSLASSLYLGVLAGFSLLWLQPVAMILGIIMLSAIGAVTLSTGKRPFRAICDHVNPVLAWGWALASLAASMVWALPQYSLAAGVLQQNLMPGLLGSDGALGDFTSKLVISISILAIATAVTWSYGTKGRGVRVYELILKIIVALIVFCFVGVVVKISLSPGGLDWGAVARGFVPDPRSIFNPAPLFGDLIAKVASEEGRDFWTRYVVDQQRDVMMAAAATAVGINMTFLFPYTLLSRGWTKEFRGLAKFDLCTGMFIPFVLATSCVVMAAGTRFHTVPPEGIDVEAGAPTGKVKDILKKRIGQVPAEELDRRIAELDPAERRLAATLVKRDAFDLARSLSALSGDVVANIIFGIGVLGMTLSTISLLMLVSGFIVCELLGLPATGWPYRLGALAAATGALGPFVWSKAAFYLVIPTSVFGLVLLPIAYITFFLMMNQKSLLGEDMPRGGRRLLWNSLMGLATGVAMLASVWMIWIKAGIWGLAGIAAFLGAAAIAHFLRK